MRARHLLAATILLAAAAPASAQSLWTGAVNSNWSNNGNWDVPPVSSPSLVVQFFGPSNGNINTVLDLGAAGSVTQLNQIVVFDNSPDPTPNFSIAPAGGRSLQFAGTQFTFSTATSTFNGSQIQQGAIGANLTVTAGIDFSVNTGLVLGLVPLQGAGSITLGGPLSAASGVTVTVTGNTQVAGGDVILTGNNNTGFNGTLALTDAARRIILSGNNAVGRGASLNTGTFALGGGIQVGTSEGAGTGSGQQFGTLTGIGGFQIGASNAESQALVGFGGANFTFDGLLTATPGSLFAKVGTGTMTVTLGGDIYLGDLAVRGGILQLAGASGGLTNTSVSGSTAAEVTIEAGATLFLNNGTGTTPTPSIRTGSAPRLTASVLRAAGGTFQIDQGAGSPPSARAVAESLGALSAISGQSTIFLDTTAGRATRPVGLTFNSGASANGATVFFRGASLGTNALAAAGTSGAPTATNVVFTTPPTTIGGIIPWGIASTTGGATPDTFAEYAANGVRPLTTYAAAFGTATDNVSIASSTAPVANTTANALRITSGTVTSSGLSLTSGALMMADGTTISGGGTVTFGAVGTPTTAYITNGGSGPALITAPINATNLSKNGPGLLNLVGAINLSAGAGNGRIAVNAGTLELQNLAGSSGVTAFQVSRGATLGATSVGNLPLGNGQTLTGNGTVNVLLTAGNGSTIAPSSLAGPGSDLASPGTLGVSNLTLQGGSNYVWFVSSALTDGNNAVTPTAGTLANFRSQYTASNLNVTGTIDLTAVTGVGADKVNLRITSLNLANERAPLYDFNKLTDTRSWVIADAIAITGFSADKFNINVSQFANFQGGENTFTISQVGNSLVLTVVPIPEPAAVLALAAGALGVVTLVRRRRAALKV